VPVYGMEIQMNEDSSLTYSKQMVEERSYNSIYAPIPFDEISKMDSLIQNSGW
jgi:hypothetical protein